MFIKGLFYSIVEIHCPSSAVSVVPLFYYIRYFLTAEINVPGLL